MSFFKELKRRNVIRIGIAYGVSAWFILQLADVVLENIAAPEWLMQAIMLLLVIGFPVVIIFAWAFEMTPEGIKKEKNVDRNQSITPQTGRKLDRMIIGILVIVVGYLLVDKLVLQDRGVEINASSEVALEEATPPAAETGPSVAVLPFVNMSGDKENEYFSDGLTETLLHMLAQLPDLRVAFAHKPWMLKCNQRELLELLGAPDPDAPLSIHELAAEMQRIRTHGIEVVVVTMGADGALLADEEGVVHARVPQIKEVNPTGSGDLLMAGLAVGIDQRQRARSAIAIGAACGTAGATHLPPELPPEFDPSTWLPQISIEVISEAP